MTLNNGFIKLSRQDVVKQIKKLLVSSLTNVLIVILSLNKGIILVKLVYIIWSKIKAIKIDTKNDINLFVIISNTSYVTKKM